jgi:hypothetical protein
MCLLNVWPSRFGWLAYLGPELVMTRPDGQDNRPVFLPYLINAFHLVDGLSLLGDARRRFSREPDDTLRIGRDGDGQSKSICFKRPV